MIQTFSRIAFSLVLIMIISHTAYSQTTENKGPGSFKSMKRNNQQFTITAEHTVVELTVYSPNMVRIRFTGNPPQPDFSYAVTGAIQPTTVSMKETATAIDIITDSLRLTIQKSPLLFSFYTKQDELINADDFGTLWTGNEITTYKKIFDGERFLGLGEKTGNLDRRGSGYTNWNTDCFGYTPDTDPLYVSIPFYIGVHDSLCYGIYLDNSSRSNFNFGASNTRFASFSVEAGEMDYYFIHHSTVAGIISSYTYLTGRMQMPPLWSLGFQQCRWSYFPDTEVLNIAKTFREKHIPLDVIYLDIDYMDHYKIFTWDKNKFPDPQDMITQLKNMGVHTTVIVDPGIKIENGYHSYEEGVAGNLFAKYPNGDFYSGEVWPGLCHFPDFTNPSARTWWGNAFEGYVNTGVDGFWNDMNEPATWGQKFPSLVEFNFDGHGGTTLEARNIYGFQMARSTYDGTKKLMNNNRPFVLTRAGFAGIQRYSAVWTGDNTPSDDHLLLGVRLVNSLGLSGVSFSGVDVGGFNADATAELYARWISVGAFTPFFRAHKMIDQKESEPWSYGEKTEAIAKNYISLRYQLLPYLYAAFYESTQTGMPVARTLAIDHTHDPNIYNSSFQNEYYFGESILVAPVKSTEAYAKVYLPEGNWFDFYSDKQYAGNTEYIVDAPLNRLPLFVKGGAIIPMQSLTQSTSEQPNDTLYLHVYAGADNSYTYYEDDGVSYDFTSGEYYKRIFTFDNDQHSLLISEVEGNGMSKFKLIKIYMHPGNKVLSSGTINGKVFSLRKDVISYIGFEKAVSYSTTIQNTNTQIQILLK